MENGRGSLLPSRNTSAVAAAGGGFAAIGHGSSRACATHRIRPGERAAAEARGLRLDQGQHHLHGDHGVYGAAAALAQNLASGFGRRRMRAATAICLTAVTARRGVNPLGAFQPAQPWRRPMPPRAHVARAINRSASKAPCRVRSSLVDTLRGTLGRRGSGMLHAAGHVLPNRRLEPGGAALMWGTSGS